MKTRQPALPPVSAVIPTYGRGRVLLDTVASLLGVEPRPREILLIEQSPDYDRETTAELERLEQGGRIRRLSLDAPSIPKAMNLGLREARSEIVLFVDDDVVPDRNLIGAHASAHASEAPDLVAGRVIQPWQAEVGPVPASPRRWVEEFMGGNFSVRGARALELGGFDENFVRVAYRFEAEFAARLRAAGGRILYEPRAVIRHLKAESGGTRAFGEHYRTIRPDHAVGEYYYLLVGQGIEGRLRRILRRPFRAVATRFHLRHPWWIPVTLISELLGLAWAIRLARGGPKLLATGPEAPA